MDLPQNIKLAIPSSHGRDIFRKAFNECGSNYPPVRYITAWDALDKAGYTHQDGVYTKSNSGDIFLLEQLAQAMELDVEINDNDDERSENAPPPGGMYSSCPVNTHSADLLTAWMQSFKIPNPVPADQLHCTILYSKEQVGGYKPINDMTILTPRSISYCGVPQCNYFLRRLGKNKECLALCFNNDKLADQFWQALNIGASWDFDDHNLHITLSYDCPMSFDIATLDIPHFEIMLDPEQVKPLPSSLTLEGKKTVQLDNPLPVLKFSLQKSNEEKQMVYGYASVIEKDGKPVVDLQGDVIDDEDMLVKAAHDFMRQYREGHELHWGKQTGEIVESVVFTKQLQDALAIDLGQVGWYIGYKVNDSTVWDMVKKGVYKAFSIGGDGIREAVA
jgi:hypothetical protein